MAELLGPREVEDSRPCEKRADVKPPQFLPVPRSHPWENPLTVPPLNSKGRFLWEGKEDIFPISGTTQQGSETKNGE
jgi:hypothetical protein